jgi:hypothetical protein
MTMTETYKTIPNKIAQLLPFEGNSTRGIWNGKTYEVYSYRTLIATADGSAQWLDAHKYSVTTSKLQNIIRVAWKLS